MDPVSNLRPIRTSESALPIPERNPPHNDEAEMALLGAILHNNRAFERVADFLKAEHFSSRVHGRIFEAIGRLIDRGLIADPITLKQYFEADADLQEIGGYAYLMRLAGSVASIVNAEDYGRTVHDLHLRRQLISLGEDMVNDAYRDDLDNEANTQIETAEQRLFNLASTGEIESGLQEFGVALKASIDAANAAFRREGQLAGVPSGFTDLDKLLGGLHPSDLLILAGRPSMGKTALATNIAFHAARTIEDTDTSRNHIVAFFSLEMSAEQLATRILAEQTTIPSERIRRGDLSNDDFERLVVVSQELERLPLYIDDTPALTIAALRRPRATAEAQPGLVDDRGRLSAADARLVVGAQREPRPGAVGDHARPQDRRQGARRARGRAVAAEPRGREPRGQAPATLRPARVRLDRAGRRRRDVRLSRRILPGPQGAPARAPRSTSPGRPRWSKSTSWPRSSSPSSAMGRSAR